MNGLGRVGANMTTRLLRGGDTGQKHSVVVYARSAEAINTAVDAKVIAALRNQFGGQAVKAEVAGGR
jgi:6-phosphogluconate dehydrogenase (decarboxylating)